MKIEFNSKEEAKAFHDMLMYGSHGIATVAMKITDCKPYNIINEETGESAFISSRTALKMLENIIERIEKDDYKTTIEGI